MNHQTFLPFTKITACGNDYLYLDCLTVPPPSDPSSLAVRLSERHFGIGADGIVLILPSRRADVGMRIFNADGSEGLMCGNAARSVGYLLAKQDFADRDSFSLETASGIRRVIINRDPCLTVSVDMGIPFLLPARYLKIGERSIPFRFVSLGNPHAVFLADDCRPLSVTDLGREMNFSPQFPGGINVERVSIFGENAVKAEVFERGSGLTLSCGSGACAAAAVFFEKQGLCGGEVDVLMPGGTLTVSKQADHFFLSGEVCPVFSGKFYL